MVNAQGRDGAVTAMKAIVKKSYPLDQIRRHLRRTPEHLVEKRAASSWIRSLVQYLR